MKAPLRSRQHPTSSVDPAPAESESPRRQVTETPASPRLWTRAFALVCAATFFGYGHNSLLTPALPLFILEHGGSASLVGVVTAMFSVTSFVFRPFIGRGVDTWSARGMAALGTLLLGVSSLGYLVYDAVLLLSVRAVHGLGWAAYNTGTKVLLSTTAPPERRGEGAGYFAMSQGVATALVPAVALWLLGLVGFTGVFVISAAAGLLATCTVIAMPPQPAPAGGESGEGFWKSLVEPDAAIAAGLEFLTKFSLPAAAVFVPLYAISLGISTESLLYYYLGYGLASISSRGLLGGWSDRIGRARMIALGTVMSAASLVLISQAGGIELLTVGGVLFGLGSAAYAPSVMALAIDLSRPDKRGAAIATYSMAFQMAYGLGGLLCGLLADAVGYPTMYLIVAITPLAALLLVVRYWRLASVAKPLS